MNFFRADRKPVHWQVRAGLVEVDDLVRDMETRVDHVRAGTAPEAIWLVEFQPVYTGGVAAPKAALPDGGIASARVSRGGGWGYHGPGQRAIVAILDLKKRSADLKDYCRTLEEWMIRTLATFGVAGERHAGQPGVFIGPDKIAAIGLKAKNRVTSWGVSLNVAPDLSHYAGIDLCGVKDAGVTSLAVLGVTASMDEVDLVLRREFHRLFGPTSIIREEP